MSDANVRRVEAVGFAIAVLGLLVAWFGGMVRATHATSVADLVFVGPLTLPAFGMLGSVVLLAATRRPRGRVFAALWAVGSAASVAIVRVRAGDAVVGMDAFLVATIVVALGACLCIVGPARRDVVTPSAGATRDG